MIAYLRCLAYPNVRYLFGTNLLGRLPNGMGTLAVALFLRSGGAGYVRVGLLTALFALATAVGSPLLGRLVDIGGQSLVLLWGALGSAGGFTLLAIVGAGRPVPAGVAVILAGGLTPPLEPCLRSLWPGVFDDPGLVTTAYALDAALQELVFVVGPLLVVGIGAATSPGGALLAIALFVFVGTLAFVGSGPVRHWHPQPRVPDWAGPLRSHPLRVLLVGLFCVGAALGVINIAVVGYADGHGNEHLSGLLLGTNGLGALIGGLMYGSRKWPATASAQVPILLGALALGYWPLVAAPGPVPMAGLTLLAGVFLAPTLACTFVVIGESAPAGTVTEAFAWEITMFIVGSAVGSALAGPLLEQAGLRATLAVPGLLGLAAVAVVTCAGVFRRPFLAALGGQRAG
jgi:MFS family permease